MKELMTKIVERWFLSDPALFTIYCNQRLRENKTMQCAVRCGKGFVEYNPMIFQKELVGEAQLEEWMRMEMIRLFLKHPCQRQPENVLKEALTLGSNMVLGEHYQLKHTDIISPDDFQLPRKQCFEWYVNKLDKILRQLYQDNDSDSDEDSYEGGGDDNEESNSTAEENNMSEREKGDGSKGDRALADQSELWEEDEMMQLEINEIIRATEDWGNLSGDMVEQIRASLVVKMDYRKVLSAFHTSILSSKRKLTRMKPNRRRGFEQMGSRYELASKLLVAVDVSGSITSRTLEAFYSAIARFFKYGVETINVVQFDVGLREVTTFQKRPRKVVAHGRGGTDFQAIFDHLKTHCEYDGCIIFTDGYAEKPNVDFRLKSKVLWVCCGEQEYNCHADWMRKVGKVCWIEF